MPDLTHAARERAQRLVEAEAQVAALTAEVGHLKERLVESEWERDNAETTAREVVDSYPREVYLPGDDEPRLYDGSKIKPIVVALRTGAIFRRRWDGEWEKPVSHSTIYSWTDVLGEGPVIDITGQGSQYLWDSIKGIQQHEHNVRSALWEFERDCLGDWLLRPLGLERDRERAGSVAEARAILRLATQVIYKLRMAARATSLERSSV